MAEADHVPTWQERMVQIGHNDDGVKRVSFGADFSTHVGLSLDERIDSLADALQGNTNVRAIDVVSLGKDNPDVLMKLVEEIVPRRPSIKYVSFMDTAFNCGHFKRVSAALAMSPELEELCVCRNPHVKEDGIRAIASATKSHCRLRFLSLSGNPIGSSGAVLLADALLSNQSLEAIALTSTNMDNAGATAIMDSIRKGGRIKFIHLGYNDIGFAGIKNTALAMSYNCQLEQLGLAGNRICSQGMAAITNGLKNNEILTDLDLAECVQNDPGALKGLLLGLASRTSGLKVLNVSSNNLTDEQAACIGAMMKTNTSLTSLNISKNSFGDIGAYHIAAGLCKNNHIETLHLCDGTEVTGQIGQAGYTAITNAIEKKNYMLCSVLLGPLPNAALSAAVAKNRDEMATFKRIRKHEHSLGSSVWPHVMSNVTKSDKADFVYLLLKSSAPSVFPRQVNPKKRAASRNND